MEFINVLFPDIDNIAKNTITDLKPYYKKREQNKIYYESEDLKSESYLSEQQFIFSNHSNLPKYQIQKDLPVNDPIKIFTLFNTYKLKEDRINYKKINTLYSFLTGKYDDQESEERDVFAKLYVNISLIKNLILSDLLNNKNVEKEYLYFLSISNLFSKTFSMYKGIELIQDYFKSNIDMIEEKTLLYIDPFYLTCKGMTELLIFLLYELFFGLKRQKKIKSKTFVDKIKNILSINIFNKEIRALRSKDISENIVLKILFNLIQQDFFQIDSKTKNNYLNFLLNSISKPCENSLF